MNVGASMRLSQPIYTQLDAVCYTTQRGEVSLKNDSLGVAPRHDGWGQSIVAALSWCSIEAGRIGPSVDALLGYFHITRYSVRVAEKQLLRREPWTACSIR